MAIRYGYIVPLCIYVMVYMTLAKCFGLAKPIASPSIVDWTMLGHIPERLMLNDGDQATTGQYHSGNCTDAYVDYNTCLSNTIPTSHCYLRQARCPSGWMMTTDIKWDTFHHCHVFKWSWFCTKSV